MIRFGAALQHHGGFGFFRSVLHTLQALGALGQLGLLQGIAAQHTEKLIVLFSQCLLFLLQLPQSLQKNALFLRGQG